MNGCGRRTWRLWSWLDVGEVGAALRKDWGLARCLWVVRCGQVGIVLGIDVTDAFRLDVPGKVG